MEILSVRQFCFRVFSGSYTESTNFYHYFLLFSLDHTDECLHNFCYRNNGRSCIQIAGFLSSFQTATKFICTGKTAVIQKLLNGRPKNHSNTCHGSGAGVSFGLQPTWNVVGRRKLLASEPQSSHITILQHSASKSQDDINTILLQGCILIAHYHWFY